MSSKKESILPQSDIELISIKSFTRSEVVDAYSTWTDVSVAERRCLEMVCDNSADVLDIGCGAGRHAGWLDGRFRTYLGIDASKPMIEAAKKNFPELSFLDDDILDLDVEDNSCDVILLMANVLDFLHPIERRLMLLERCSMWLRDGGAIIGSSHLTESDEEKGFYKEDYHNSEIHQYRLSASEMVEEAERFGLEVALFVRDYRKQPACWAYWVARKTR